jgi:L-alanine-DL-glutamate epimerase-like enolase superfamily enzyme
MHIQEAPSGAAPLGSPGAAPLTIVAVEALVARVRLEVPWQIATGPLESMFATIVRVELANGVVGWGECLVRQAPSATKAVVDELLSSTVVSMDAWDVEGIWDRMYRTMRYRGHSRGFFLEAIAGVDTAIWDALGRSLGQPVWRLLHGEGRRSVPCYASSILLSDDPRVTVAEAERLAAAGWPAVKVKVGAGVDQDVRTIAMVRSAVGPAVDIMLDANGVYRADEAITLARKLSEFDIRWLEEPVPADDLHGYRALAGAHTGVPLAGGEAEYVPSGFLPFLQDRIYSVIQPDVARAGGITATRRIALLADAFNVRYAPHTGASAALCISASLHLAASMPNFMIHEHMYVHQPLQDLVGALPQPRNGVIDVPSGPGLGVEVDESVLRASCTG